MAQSSAMIPTEPPPITPRLTLDKLPDTVELVLKRPLALDGRRPEVSLRFAIGEAVHGTNSWMERFGLECRIGVPPQMPAREFPAGTRFTLVEKPTSECPWTQLGLESAAPSVPLRLRCVHYTHTTIATEGQPVGTNFWNYRPPTIADLAILFEVVPKTAPQP